MPTASSAAWDPTIGVATSAIVDVAVTMRGSREAKTASRADTSPAPGSERGYVARRQKKAVSKNNRLTEPDKVM